eukprot:tig00001545_g9339.t1
MDDRRRNEVSAYFAVLRAFNQQGELSKDRERILGELRSILHISPERDWSLRNVCGVPPPAASAHHAPAPAYQPEVVKREPESAKPRAGPQGAPPLAAPPRSNPAPPPAPASLEESTEALQRRMEALDRELAHARAQGNTARAQNIVNEVQALRQRLTERLASMDDDSDEEDDEEEAAAGTHGGHNGPHAQAAGDDSESSEANSDE